MLLEMLLVSHQNQHRHIGLQTCAALSKAEAEYITLAEAAQESIWLQRLLMDMNENSVEPMTIFEDNQSTITMTKNPQHHGRAKHIDNKFHYIRKMVTMNKIQLKYCKSHQMIADMLTKENAIVSAYCTHQSFLEELYMVYKQRFVNLSLVIRNIEVS